MNGEKIKSILQSKPTGQQCSAQGWVRTFRANRFIALNDGSTIENLQCVVDFEQLDESVLKQITTGAALHLQGELVEEGAIDQLDTGQHRQPLRRRDRAGMVQRGEVA